MSASETMITEAAQALYREETNQDISGDARPTWGSLGLGQEPYRELAAAAIDAAEPLIREQIANELKRNRPGPNVALTGNAPAGHGGTEWRSGYRAGYDDAIAQVEHGGDHHG